MKIQSLLVFSALAFGCGASPVPVEEPPSISPPAPSVTEAPPAPPIASAAPDPTPPPSAAPADPTPPPPPPASPGSNLNVGSMDVNGLKVSDLSCRLDDVGLMTAIVLIGGLAKQKQALKACGKDEPKIEWTFDAGKAKDVKVTAKNAAIEKCVGKAMTRVAAPVAGKCSATLMLDQ